MTEEHERRIGGRGFSPSERNVDEDDDAAATVLHGSGKQFAKDVGDPDSDGTARRIKGSGKQFAWDAEESEPGSRGEPGPRDEPASGSGKQFRPGEGTRG